MAVQLTVPSAEVAVERIRFLKTPIAFDIFDYVKPHLL